MGEKNKNKISIANILALIGLAGIGFCSFMGMYIKSQDGTPTGAIIGAIVIVAVLGFLLFISIKAKSASDNFKSWRIAEYCSIVVYVVFAILAASPFQDFFHIISAKDSLKEKGLAEVSAINELYENYNTQQQSFLNNAVQQLKNFQASGQDLETTDPDLVNLMNDVVCGDVDGWEEKAHAILTLEPDKRVAEVEEGLNNWDIQKLAGLATTLETLNNTLWDNMETTISNFENYSLIPVIAGGNGLPYSFDGWAQFDLGSAPESQFSVAIRESHGNTVLGWILYGVLNFLVLLSYFATSRSTAVPISRRKVTIGETL